MRKLLAVTLAATTLTLAVSLSSPVLAADAADPTVHQIYEAAEAGHFDQAQQMMDQVLRDHPQSSKAHYVQAELYAKEGKTNLARSELAKAEQIDPGLTHENQQSVKALKSQLGMLQRTSEGPRVIGMTSAPAASHFPWGMVLILVLAVGALWMLFRRRSGPVVYSSGAPAVSGGPGGFGGVGGGYAPGYGPHPMGGGMGGGGIGSGIAGGLASGLAVGAGVVAGEELAHHFLDGRSEGVAPPVENREWNDTPSSNNDMGGSDFGVNDAGSWDDSGGGGGGGGGDDWT
jgi:hypothetical protein